MINQPTMYRAMLGYAVWVEIEDSLRNWLADKLIENYGSQWSDQFPTGIWNKLCERYNEVVKLSDLSQVRELLEHSDFPFLFDIVKYRNQTRNFVPQKNIDDIDYFNQKLYGLRNQIAHKPYSFTMRHLDDLLECANWVLEIVAGYGIKLSAVVNGIDKNPEEFIEEIPDSFVLRSVDIKISKLINNLPPLDYEYDGGFVGRKTETKDISRRLLDKRRDPIITVSGAGGVGKTALAHYVCEEILDSYPEKFDGLIWISAKKDRLTLTGIEEIEQPIGGTFDAVLSAILTTFGFDEYLDKDIATKKNLVQEVIIDSAELGVLLIVDNLETILDDTDLIDFIKDIPLPNKVLITSRIGLGEIERRLPLKEMSSNDAINLFRKVAIEKSAKALAQLPNDVIRAYVERMSGYPLVIKWVVGQASLNIDIDRFVQTINSTNSDISKFCFEYIYDKLLSENAKLILCCLASSEQDLAQPVLMHVTNFDNETFENTMRELELTSLVIPNQYKDETRDKINTKYGVLPLTKAYLTSKSDSLKRIKSKLQSVQNLVEEGRRAVKHFQFSLEYLGAGSEEELIATKYVQSAFYRNRAGDYNGALEELNRASQIAPNFASIYRNWAVIEADNENYERSVELFEKATQLNQHDATSWYYWGELERKHTNYVSARKHLDNALRLAEDKTSVLVALGNVEKQDSNFKDAINLFQEAITLAENDDNKITNRSIIIAYTSMADAYYRWGEIYEIDKQLDISIEKTLAGYEIMLKVFALGSSDVKTIETYMQCGLKLGFLYKKKHDIINAQKYLSDIISSVQKSLNPKQRKLFTQACYVLILLLVDMDELSGASVIYEKGLPYLFPNDSFRSKYLKLQHLITSPERYIGVFNSVKANKGYGFIRCNDLEVETVFAHISNILDDITDSEFADMQGTKVSFCVEYESPSKASATLIKIIT